jgi:GTPase SAR1 family protein
MQWNIRIGLIGPANSGKTVLLTSLLAHLKAYNSAEFNLGSGIQIYDYTELPTDSGQKQFDLEAAIHSLRDGVWPRKTNEAAPQTDKA